MAEYRPSTDRHRSSVDDDGPNDENVGNNLGYLSSVTSEVTLNSLLFNSTKIDNSVESKLRRNLKFFFMNPYEKWKVKRRFPWKLILQFIKIVLITTQLAIFGSMHSSYVTFVERNTIALKHIFLKDWTPGYETLPYPPATGAYAVYTERHMYDHINYAMKAYYEHDLTEDLGVGGYQLLTKNGTRLPMQICIRYYTHSHVFSNGSFVFDSEEAMDCYPILPIVVNGTETFDIVSVLKRLHHSIHVYAFLDAKVSFLLRSINLETYSKHVEPKCYIFNVTILFDYSKHDGQMLVSLLTNVKPLQCQGEILYLDENNGQKKKEMVFYAIILLVSTLSMILCIRSIYRAFRTQKAVVQFFLVGYGKKLKLCDRTEFLNLWYVLIVVNDIITIVGTGYLIETSLHVRRSTPTNLDRIGLLLGTGSLFTWFGGLRYIGFFKKYNILLITLKRATPNVLRFLVCAAFMYGGFMFCGWVVLGPYHIKFRTLSTTSECMFALINGDDMFATFASLQTVNSWVWIYSRVYLYTFISLFIYIVLSLFIAVIMDAYETIKHFYENGFPQSDLFEFIHRGPDEQMTCAKRSRICWGAFACCYGIFSCSEECPCCGAASSCCERNAVHDESHISQPSI